MEIFMEKILLVEDDYYLKSMMKELLTKKGYEIIIASNQAEAVHYVMNRQDIDLYIIDIMLPDGDGFHICRLIRERNINPIIFLTACEVEESVVKGLDLGADDYITKPFRTAELLSRIQAHLRRLHMNIQTDVLCSGALVFHKRTEKIIVNQEVISLRPVELSLLKIFLNNPGIILKRDWLLRKLWDNEGNFVEDNTLSVHISRLRERLGEMEGQPCIETIRKIGYRWIFSVRGQMNTGEEEMN
jgi:DNA-binding response OmpR family regulator